MKRLTLLLLGLALGVTATATIAFRGGSYPIFCGILGQGRPERWVRLGVSGGSIPDAVPGGHPLSRGGSAPLFPIRSVTTGVGEKPDEQAT